MLKINYLDTIVELPGKIHFGRSTIFRAKNAMFVKVNRLKMTIYF
jgi:hypothetical protein